MVCKESSQKVVTKVATGAVLVLNVCVAMFVIQAIISTGSNVNEQVDLKVLLDENYVKCSRLKNTKGKLQREANEEKTAMPSLEFLSLLKPVAHFSGLDFHEESKYNKSGTVSIRNWANSEGSERTLLYNDMTYQNGSMTVPVAGVYHITSHVKFYVEDNKKDHNSSQTFHHQIVRYSASSRKQVVLFENVVTECREGINDGAHLEYPSLTGGLAQFDAGDHVIVRVSHFDLLKHDRDWHYFDIYLV